MRDISKSSRAQKEDNAAVKRVELHLHTQYSAMDAVSSPKALIERAKFWGHKAIGITDHGVVQAFPDAFKAKGKDGIKVLYGVEAYLYDTPLDDTIVVFDIETTGLDSRTEAITEIGAVKVKDREIIDTFETFVNPGKPIPANITELTGITDKMVADAPPISEAFEAFCEFVGDSAVIAHNAKFDVGFMQSAAKKLGKTFNNMVLDTLELSRFLQPELSRHKLDIIAEHLGIENGNHHRAVNDATVTAKIWFAFIPKLAAKGFEDLYSVMTLQPGRLEEKPRRSYHTIIYAKDLNGLKNLYAIVSHSHLAYFKRFPRVPKSFYTVTARGLSLARPARRASFTGPF